MTAKSLKFYLSHPIVAVRRMAHAIYEYRHPEEPWLSQGAVRFLEENLKNDMMLFEWGSGRSTLWFSQRVKKVVSIEYHQGWADKVEQMLKDKGQSNVELKYIPLEHPKEDPTPRHYDKTPDYVTEIYKYPKESFDVLIVDGHYRPTCIDKGLDYLKSGGFLVIDNSNRLPMAQWGVPSDWPVLHQSENVMTQTTIWQKK